jgi:iron complex transport system ATP-binding protein
MTSPVDAGRTCLWAKAVRVSLGEREVLGGVTLAVRSGCWTSIVGPNGAGKSTLLRTMAGLLPFQGSLDLLGRPVGDWPARERARHLCWLGQGEAVADDLRVYDLVMLGRLPHQDWLATPTPADHTAVEQALRATQAWDWRERGLRQLSGGERQRVLLARALAVQAQVLLMDEPLANLDPPHQADWIALVRGLVARGHTVVSVLHEMTLALQADDLVVMAAGQVLHQGRCDDPATQAALCEVFSGRIAIHQIDGQRVALPRV